MEKCRKLINPLNCVFPVDHINGSSDFESGDLVSVVTRVMVSQNRLYSDSEEVVALQVFSEVIEMEGKEVNTSWKSYGSLTSLNLNFVRKT